METLLASPRSSASLSAARPVKAHPGLPQISILPERIPLVAGIWIEPGSDPGHAAHLEPVSTLLEHLQRQFPATPFRLLVPPRIAEANWLRQLTSKAGCPVSVTSDLAPDAPPVETLARHSHAILCLAPGQSPNEEIIQLLRWKREGRIRDTEAVFGGPVEFWDLSRGSRARRQHLAPTLARTGFAKFARNVRAFNLRSRRQAPSLEEAVAHRKAELCPEDAPLDLTRGQVATLERYALNAAIGIRFLPLARSAQIAWSIFAPLAAALLVASSQSAGETHRMLLWTGGALLPVAALARFLHGRWLHLAHHHQALGEAMRLHFVRGVAGLPGLQTAEIPLPPRAPGWFSIALDHWISGLAQSEPVLKPAPERIRHLRQTWLRSEAESMAAAATRTDLAAKRHRKLSMGAWTATGLTGAGLLSAALQETTGPTGWILAAIMALSLFAASLFGHRAALDRLESQRAQRDAQGLTSASDRLQDPGTGAELAASTQLLLALTNETLAAHAERMNHEVERGFSPLPDFR